MKNIVIIGGGTGTFTLLSGLRQFPVNNTVVVSSADDGGSTGILRKDLNIFPPGDIRQCLVGLSYTQQEMRDLFNYRFSKGSLKGHNVGNIILSALQDMVGLKKAITLTEKILNVRGQVLPVTLTPTTLTAVLENGKKIIGEHNIDEPKSDLRFKIEDLRLEPKTYANPDVIRAIKEADAIVFGPGDLYTSTLPNLLALGMKKVINKSQAKKIFIVNIMSKHGQTDNFDATDFIKEFKKYSGMYPDLAIINTQKPSIQDLKRYQKEKAKFISPAINEIKQMPIKTVFAHLISSHRHVAHAHDALQRSYIRHDGKKIAKIILKYL